MIITIQNGTYTARIDTVGAQLISLKDTEDKEYIWQRDPKVWPSCSPLLFPVVGNCRGGRTRIEGEWYELPKHGFCRGADFSVSSQTDSHATFTIGDTPETLASYPYRFSLSLTYSLSGDTLAMDYRVENTDNRDIHYNIGAHPGFICPMEDGESFEDYVLQFEEEEDTCSATYDLSKGQFDMANQKHLLSHSRTLPLSYGLFEDDAIYFDEIKSRKVALVNPKTGQGVEVDYPGFETIAFWTAMPAKGRFLCVEPWNGSAARSDEDDEFLSKHHLQFLRPGESRRHRLKIRKYRG